MKSACRNILWLRLPIGRFILYNASTGVREPNGLLCPVKFLFIERNWNLIRFRCANNERPRPHNVVSGQKGVSAPMNEDSATLQRNAHWTDWTRDLVCGRAAHCLDSGVR